MFDLHFFTKTECCASGWAVLNPYTFSLAPPAGYPPSQNWKVGHPSLAPEQLLWEVLIQHASIEKRIPSPAGTVVLKVFKGDVPDVQLYNLTTSGLAPSTILDVGGNYGGVTLALAEFYTHARIVVLEPNPLLCRFLMWNIRRQGLTDRVWPLCTGAAAKVGEVLMQPCNEPWIGAPVNTCMNLAMRTFNTSSDSLSGPVVKVFGLQLSVATSLYLVSTTPRLWEACRPSVMNLDARRLPSKHHEYFIDSHPPDPTPGSHEEDQELVSRLSILPLTRSSGSNASAAGCSARRWLGKVGSSQAGLRRTLASECWFKVCLQNRRSFINVAGCSACLLCQ